MTKIDLKISAQTLWYILALSSIFLRQAEEVYLATVARRKVQSVEIHIPKASYNYPKRSTSFASEVFLPSGAAYRGK